MGDVIAISKHQKPDNESPNEDAEYLVRQIKKIYPDISLNEAQELVSMIAEVTSLLIDDSGFNAETLDAIFRAIISLTDLEEKETMTDCHG